MQLPEGSVILIIVWGMAVLILWNLYHFSQALRQKTFIAVLTLVSAGLFGGIIFLHFHQSPNLPGNRTGVVIFPLAEEPASSVGARIGARGLAIADMIGERLQQTPHTPFYQIPTDALFDAAHRDSLADLDYVLRFAEQAELPVIGFGTFKIGPRTNHHDSWQSSFQLFDLRKTEAADAHTGVHLRLPQQFGSLQEMTAELARAIFQEWTGDEKPPAPVWQDRLDDELLQRYYAARLAIAADHTEPALQQACALRQTDADFTPFANLYSRALMANLRRKPASKMEWEDSLRSALPRLKRAAKQDSLHGESSRLLGEIYIRLEKWNEAERALLQARRREPTDSEIYLLFGHLHASRLEPLGFRSELDLYEYARRLNPINIDAGLAAAEYLLLESREKEALDLLERLRHLNPNHPGVLMSLGRIHIVKGDAVKIFEVYERILALQPNNADAYYNLGIAYYNRDDFENAVKLFERAIALNNHPDARMYLAQIYERQGQIDNAIAHLRERIKLSRGDDDKVAAEARRHLYEILLARGEIPPHLRPDSLKN